MNWAAAIVLIVAILVIGAALRARHPKDDSNIAEWDADRSIPSEREEELEEEITQLRERLAVLERIATEDREAKRISEEIDKLRDD